MKKERTAGLFVCLVLLAGLQLPRFFGFPQLAVLFLPQMLWDTVSMGQSWDSIYPRADGNRRPNPAVAFVCAAWPPVGAIYSEAKFLTGDFAHSGDPGEMAAKDPHKRGSLREWLRRKK